MKTLTDLSPADLKALLRSAPVVVTVADLIRPNPPDPLTNGAKWENQRRYPSETKLNRVSVKIIACGVESNDHDYHIVIENPADPTQTMVSELPDPACPDVANNSILRARYKALREWFDTNIKTPTGSIEVLPAPFMVDIIGVPFWDGKHPGNVHGAAANFHEIHPILNFVKNGVFAIPD